jgi:hypothetical protein
MWTAWSWAMIRPKSVTVLSRPTKRKKIHPIQMTWSRFIVDAVFQGGKKHCNHGDSVARMIKQVVADIRIHYRWNVPIIFGFDSGYFD